MTQPAILYWPDTIQQAGNFLEKAAQWYQPDQLKRIEDTIMSLGNYVPAGEKERINQLIFRLLSRIPREKLQSQDAIALFSDKEPAANDELVNFISPLEVYTTRMYFNDQSVNVNDLMTDEVLTAEQRLSTFNNAHNRHSPDADTYKEPLEMAIDSYNKIRNNLQLPESLVSTALVSVAGTCVLVLKSDVQRKYDKKLRTTDYDPIKEIIQDCVARYTSSDAYAEEHYSPGSMFSSTPKSEAVGGLIYLYILTQDESLLPLIKQFSVDKNAVVRFYLLQAVGYLYECEHALFWEIILERLKNEEDKFILSFVVNELDRKKIFDGEQPALVKALEIARERVDEVKKDSKFVENFLLVSLSFYRMNGDMKVKDLLLKSVSKNVLITQTLIRAVFKIIEPNNYYRNLQDQIDTALSKRLVGLLLIILNDCEKKLVEAVKNVVVRTDTKEMFNTLNRIVLSIYSSLQVNEYLKKHKNQWPVSKEDQRMFYLLIKALLVKVMQISEKIGFMQANTAHRFIEILGLVLDFDAEYALHCTRRITEMTQATGYIQDRLAIQEAVKFTEKALGNHKELLTDQKAFSHIKALLVVYVTAGWPEALKLLWQLDDIFR